MGYLPDFCMNTIFHIFIEREKRGKNRAFKKRSRKNEEVIYINTCTQNKKITNNFLI